ncbi:MAG: metallophosphoesterase family protein [Frankiaceae bacterium]|nr:metallophosphoesterase family protein [Frankiaceae bacterium]MBV9869860.1 metallophosphoesterase family protein [Frankiaceae bacterium]
MPPPERLRHGMRRRDLLKTAALTVAGGMLWSPTRAAASTPVGPQWIALGPDPRSQMWVSWSSGSASTPASPPAPRIRWGLTSSYGKARAADASRQVPIPSGPANEPPEKTFYNRVLLTGLQPGRTYHYAVSNDGVSWGPDTTFRTAPTSPRGVRFTAFGDQAASQGGAGAMAALVASLDPDFHVLSGDLAYATPEPMTYPDVAGFVPAEWDKYLGVVGPAAAGSIPWMASVGAHEIEPLANFGYDGFVTRFPQAYDPASGSPVAHSFTYENVAVIHLDGNDLSAQETTRTGYTGGAQTAWLKARLSSYRATGSGIDFIVVVCNCCCYSTNQKHGSDGGLRDTWGPLFDHYKVDLVISGHVHAYERTHPVRGGQPTRTVASGGVAYPASDGTTYICAGGGGNGLYRSWYGTSTGGDGGSATAPKIWRWNGGVSQNVPDSARGFSAYRRGVLHCVCVDVTPPNAAGQTTMAIRALMPAQSGSTVTSISAPTVMDRVTLVRTAA